MADSDAQETRQPAKDSPFSIKNLLNIEDKPTKPKTFLGSSKGVFEGSFFSRLGDLSFPRFELPTQRIGLSAQYLERASTWWYPYTLGTHLRTAGTLNIINVSSIEKVDAMCWSRSQCYSKLIVLKRPIISYNEGILSDVH